ncbi:MAG: hypothetical protein PWP23_183 [Candidatus Sumerlaeota bacterium]|nr:hypothetical protein [Candidatus Sumerlaeota bacterium]
MGDLTTNYLGFELQSPLVVSASPLCQEIANIRRMEDAGASAIVLHSLFEEQINIESNTLDTYLSQGSESYGEATSYHPDLPSYKIGPDAYLEHILKAKAAVDIPIIASLNGVSPGGWTDYARLMAEAGADALELNIYFTPTDMNMTSEAVEATYVDLVKSVKQTVKIPVAVKIGPYFSSMANMARKLDEAGADALVLFNRFYQPDFDLEYLEVTPNLQLSNSLELRLRLRWVAILYSRIKADMAITGGVHEFTDVLKSMMAGAKVAMMTSALLRHGIGHIATVRRQLFDWLEENEYESIQQMQGSLSMKSAPNATAYERANYLKVLSSYAGSSATS